MYVDGSDENLSVLEKSNLELRIGIHSQRARFARRWWARPAWATRCACGRG